VSKTLRTVAVIAGAVALVATGIGAAAALAAPAGMAGSVTVAGLSTATLSSIATYASAVGMAASIGAGITAFKPFDPKQILEIIAHDCAEHVGGWAERLYPERHSGLSHGWLDAAAPYIQDGGG